MEETDSKRILDVLEKMENKFLSMVNELADRIESMEEVQSDRIVELKNEILLKTPREKIEKNLKDDEKFTRRSSGLFGDTGEDIREKLEGQNLVLRAAVPVPEDKKLKTITIASIIWLKGQVRRFHADTQDYSKKYINFFPESEAKNLVNNEKRIRSDGSELLSYDNIYHVSDGTLMGMVARYLRPLTRDEYNQMFLKGVRTLRAANSSWNFGVEDYDTELHTQLNTFVDQVDDVYEVIETGATAEDKELWPAPVWGKSSNEGLLKLVQGLLGKFQLSIQAAIGLDKIEKFKGLKEYLDALRSVNDDLCTEAKKLKKKNAAVQPSTKVADLVKENEHEIMRKKLRDGVREARPAREMYEKARINRLEVYQDANTKMHLNDQDFQQEESGELNALTYTDLVAIREPIAGRAIVDPKGSKVIVKEILPCFKYFVNECTGHCEYSHSPKAMEQYRDMLWKKLSKSRFGGLDWVDLQLRGHKDNTPNRTATGPIVGTPLRVVDTIEDLEAETLLEDLLCRESLVGQTELRQ